MDFALTETETMTVEMAGEFAARHLAEAVRGHEAERGLPRAVTEAFADSGLDALAEGGEDAAEVSWPGRTRALMALAQVDGAAALSLWFGAAVPAWARRLGVGAERSKGLTWLQWVDSVEEASAIPYAPSGPTDRLLVLDRTGAWRLLAVQAKAIPALALHAAGPHQLAGGEVIASGMAEASRLRQVVAEARLALASILVGVAAGSCAYAEQYVQDRVTFGRPVAQHQGAAFMVAEMAIAVEGAQLLAYRAGWDLERGELARATDAYLQAAEAALFATSHGVQLLGGHGFMKDHPVEKWMREARALALLWGGVDAARRDAAEGT